MNTITRDQFISRLTNDWQPYITRYQQLSAQEQSAFLQKQGYARFADLLAHILAWWQDGAQVVLQMQLDPAFPLAEYNVDDFNARAVKQVEGLEEPAVIQAFDTQRQAMQDLVTRLPDQQLYQANINTRLYYEIMAHWSEHVLETPETAGSSQN